MATCPAVAIYKRERWHRALIDGTSAAAGGCCITGCPYKKVLQLEERQVRSASSATRVSKPVSRPFARETCVGRIRYLGVLSTALTPMRESATSTENEKICTSVNWTCSSIRNDPAVIEQALKDGVPQGVIDAAQQSPVYKMAMDWKTGAAALHPEYRTLPMVWCVAPLSPIRSAADAVNWAATVFCRMNGLRIRCSTANLLTAGDAQPVLLALKRMLAMRHYKRCGNRRR
ncbi:hypothetical protein KCP76_21770 [Salmonella enterica subsp. enterica serovar Weltevreden]|nr:hypothetical protein KCP76_21770 [Salmonella enterica subsp. enterica serovar Weltevreden]